MDEKPIENIYHPTEANLVYGAGLLRRAAAQFREYENHHRRKLQDFLASDACRICGTTGWGSDHEPCCPVHPEFDRSNRVGMIPIELAIIDKITRNQRLADEIERFVSL